MRTCSRCGLSKPLSQFYKNGTSKGRPECKQCTKEIRDQKKEADLADYLLKEMSGSILKRSRPIYGPVEKHKACYIGIECSLGKTVDEVYRLLKKHFYDDTKSLLDNGLRPSVDRIDPKGDYELTNIRIIDKYENGRLGFESANEARKKPVIAIFQDGTTEIYGSIREASCETDLNHTNVAGLIRRRGVSRRDRIRFEFVE